MLGQSTVRFRRSSGLDPWLCKNWSQARDTRMRSRPSVFGQGPLHLFARLMPARRPGARSHHVFSHGGLSNVALATKFPELQHNGVPACDSSSHWIAPASTKADLLCTSPHFQTSELFAAIWPLFHKSRCCRQLGHSVRVDLSRSTVPWRVVISCCTTVST